MEKLAKVLLNNLVRLVKLFAVAVIVAVVISIGIELLSVIFGRTVATITVAMIAAILAASAFLVSELGNTGEDEEEE